MPSRVIRSVILDSFSLSQVSLEAEFTFWRMLLVADDYGRLDGRCEILHARLYPTRPAVSRGQVVDWINELAGLEDPPIRFYHEGKRPYIQLCNWERHRGKGRRGEKSLFPGPCDASEEMHADPRNDMQIRPRDEGRGTRDEGRRSEKTLNPRTQKSALAKRAADPAVPDWSLKAAELLREQIERRQPSTPIKANSRLRWGREIAKLGKKPPPTWAGDWGKATEAVILWLFEENLTRSRSFVVLSGATLVEKWGRIVSVMRRAHPDAVAEQEARVTSMLTRKPK